MENSLQAYMPVVSDIKNIIYSGRNEAYHAVGKAMIQTYWNIGKRIVEDEQQGEQRAEYGRQLIKTLSQELTKEFGTGFSKRNLDYYRKFYLYFPDDEIVNACVHNLTWTHFRALLRVDNDNARLRYLNEASKEGWSSRTLDRNIGTQYYFRLMQAPAKEAVIEEMHRKTTSLQNPSEIVKNPIVAEFLGFRSEDSFLEPDLENSILSHIRDFLLEMGCGFAFVSRQQVQAMPPECSEALWAT